METLANMLEKTNKEKTVILVDRGSLT